MKDIAGAILLCLIAVFLLVALMVHAQSCMALGRKGDAIAYCASIPGCRMKLADLERGIATRDKFLRRCVK